MYQRFVFIVVVGLLMGVSPTAAQELGLPPDYYSYLDQGQLLLENGDLQRAVLALERANELSGGKSIEATTLLAVIYHRMGRYRMTVRNAQKLMVLAESDRDLGGAYHLLGVGLFGDAGNRRADLEEVEKAFRRAIELIGDSVPMTHYNLALVLKRLHRHDEALKETRKLLKREPIGPGSDHARILLCQIRREKAPFESPTDPKTVDFMIEDPKIIHHPKLKNAQGTLVARVVVDPEGCVNGVEIKESPATVTQAQIMDNIQKFVYRPALRSGNPLAVYQDLVIRYR